MTYSQSNYSTTFSVLGSFYDLQVGSTIFKCRNLLKISRLNTSKSNIDAIFIMLNPGSALPQNHQYQPIKYNLSSYTNSSNNYHFPINLIPAIPDNVQYYVMDIMDSKNWNNVNIINLSDLIDTSSENFSKTTHPNFKSLSNNIKTNNIHSIFYRDFSELLSLGITNENIPKIACWGTDKSSDLTTAALSFFYNNSIYLKGLSKNNTGIFKNYNDVDYYYLKPKNGPSILPKLLPII